MHWLMAFIHHFAAFTLVALLVGEWLLLRGELTLAIARRLARLDMFYGLAAMALIAVGLLRVFYYEKGSAYYFHSIPFLIKMGLFVLVGLLSIIPTREFLSWRSVLAINQLPVLEESRLTRLRQVIALQLMLLIPIILCAAMTAKGIGFFS